MGNIFKKAALIAAFGIAGLAPAKAQHFNPMNPAHPLSPMNPANPASPLHHSHSHAGSGQMRDLNDKELGILLGSVAVITGITIGGIALALNGGNFRRRRREP